MNKILRNYWREQRKNIFQILGLGLLIFIMTASFLGINFSNSNLKDSYMSLTDGQQYQWIRSKTYSNLSFNNISNDDEFWLNNLNYYNYGKVNENLLAQSTFQINKVEQNNSTFYQFQFYKDDDDSSLNVGENIYEKTGQSFVNFEVIVPNGFATTYDDNPAHTWAQLVDSYVYQDSTQGRLRFDKANKINYFIRDTRALLAYNNDILPRSKANPLYTKADIKKQGQLYAIIMAGALFTNQNIENVHTIVVSDLLTSGKVFTFDSYHNIYNRPITVAGGGNKDALSLLQGKGSDTEKKQNILVYKQFADLNNIHIGDSYIIAGQEFRIVGFATSQLACSVGYNSDVADMGNAQNLTQVWMNPEGLGVVEQKMNTFTISDVDYFYYFNPYNSSQDMKRGYNDKWLFDIFQVHNRGINAETNQALIYQVLPRHWISFIDYDQVYDDVYIYNWASFYNVNIRISVTNQISTLFLILIFVISLILTLMVIFKLIHKNQKMIGILKAAGYKDSQLSGALVMAIVVNMFIFSMIGVIGGVLIGHILMLTYSSTIILVNYGWYINWQLSALLVVGPVVGLGIISFFITLFLVKEPPLVLINSLKGVKGGHSAYSFFLSLSIRLSKARISYKNKLVGTVNLRGIGKILMIIFINVATSICFLFCMSATQAVNEAFNGQLKGFTSHYFNEYHYNDLKENFYDTNADPIYAFKQKQQILASPSIYNELLNDLELWIADPHDDTPINIDLRGKYLMGSELYKIYNIILPYVASSPEVKEWVDNNIAMINYATNNMGQASNDLMINFGTIPYIKNQDLPLAKIDSSLYSLDYNSPSCYYDGRSRNLAGACYGSDWGDNSLLATPSDPSYLNPDFKTSSFDHFDHLSSSSLIDSIDANDQQYNATKAAIVQSLGLTNADINDFTFVPIAGSTLDQLNFTPNKAYLFNIKGLDNQNKAIIGITYDVYSNINLNSVFIPYIWLNRIMYDEENVPYFDENPFYNAKLSNSSTNDFNQYMSIISQNNDYKVNLRQINNTDYIHSKELITAMSSALDIANKKHSLKVFSYSVESLIFVMGLLLLLLSLLIILIVTDLLVKENLGFITLLRSQGYNPSEIAYNFLAVIVPVMVISSVAAVLIVPMLNTFLISAISQLISTNLVPKIVWWQYSVMFIMSVGIFLLSYVSSWKSNTHSKQLAIAEK